MENQVHILMSIQTKYSVVQIVGFIRPKLHGMEALVVLC